jgi:hypothetical protein
LNISGQQDDIIIELQWWMRIKILSI